MVNPLNKTLSISGCHSIRAATAEDQTRLAYLVHFNAYVHRHLDYRPPLEWIGSYPFSILEERGEALAALACPPDPPRVAWLRLFAVAYHTPYKEAWQALWPQVLQELRHDPHIVWAAAIPLHDWFEDLLTQSSFKCTHSIVMLNWEKQPLPPAKTHPSLVIRPMTLDDVPTVQIIDTAAFVPIWQNSASCLEFAYRQAAVASVAEIDHQLVGYQISTPTQLGGHLARLAILPHLQGQGIGYMLLHDLLDQFQRRGARQVTVNTQKENQASLALYQKLGFKLTGEEYPIYQFTINKTFTHTATH